MSLYHQLWVWPDAGALKQGREDLRRAEESRAKSERERQYIHALAIYYQDNPKLDDGARALAYSIAMEEVHKSFPTDDNAAAFYALSLISLRPESQADGLSNRKKAIAILNRLFAAEPDNPGFAHYLIHATDTPELAPLGLRAARSYAKIAPDSPHALHMPSHIFTDLGLWQESIDSNLASAGAAGKITNSHVIDDAGDQLHALSFLEYAYLQSGRDADARRVIDEVQKVPGAGPEEIANSETMFEAEYIEETHQWTKAVALTPHTGSYPMAQLQAFAVRAIGEARTGDVSAARADIENFRKSFAAMQERMKGMSMGMMGGMQHGGENVDQIKAEAWLAYAEGKPDEALAKITEAANHSDHPMKMGGVPGIPPREILGDLLLALHKPVEALAAYEAALKVSPNRFNSLYGAARAAQLSGNVERAKHYYSELVRISGPNADRPELQEARAFGIATR